jgi:hypothetical protein
MKDEVNYMHVGEILVKNVYQIYLGTAQFAPYVSFDEFIEMLIHDEDFFCVWNPCLFAEEMGIAFP